MPVAVAKTPGRASGAIPEQAVVRLSRPIKAAGLGEGAKGTVVHVYEEAIAYEVEFIRNGKRIRLLTVGADHVELAGKN